MREKIPQHRTEQHRENREKDQAIVLTFNAGGIRGSYCARTAGRPCSLDCFSAMPMAVLVSEVASSSSFTFFRNGSNNSSGELWRAEKGGDDNMAAHKKELLSLYARCSPPQRSWWPPSHLTRCVHVSKYFVDSTASSTLWVNWGW